MNAIQTRDLVKKYRDRSAVDSLNLSVEKGEFFSLLGLNGAGKTTTIKMLCCLLAPTSGDAVLSGESIISNPDAVKRKINVSPQETAVAPNLSVRENLELIAGIYGIPKKTSSEKVSAMVKLFDLTDRQKDAAKNLSGGMQRRLSIAMALITEPEILFLDEPTLGLDVRARRDLWKMLLSLKGKVTVILTTHYLEEAEALSDRIGIIHAGKIRITGTADQLRKETGQSTLEEAFLKLTEQGETL